MFPPRFSALSALFVCYVPAFVPRLAAAGPPDNPPPPLVAGAEHQVIFREDYAMDFRFYRLPDDTLYVKFGTQPTSSHMDPRKQRFAAISKDEGRTWQLTDREEVNPAFRSGPKRLVDVSNYGWRHDTPDRRAHYEAMGLEVRDTPDQRIAYNKGCYVRISTDNGATWNQRELTVPPQALLASFRDDRAFLRVNERTLMRSFYGKPVARVRYYEAWIMRSDDDGETWTFGPLAASVEEDVSHGETAIAQAANGDIVAMMRTEPAYGTCMWVCRSSDLGKTWSKPVKTPLHGHPAHLLKLRDGRLLCTYGVRDQPIGIRACLSRDDGRTWKAEDIVVLRTGADFKPDSGYPVTIEGKDGTLITVYYLTRGEKTGIEVTRWRSAWK
jgi:Neuraminidase (sialidase)